MSRRWKIRKRNAALREQHEARMENNRQRTEAAIAKLMAQVKEQDAARAALRKEQA